MKLYISADGDHAGRLVGRARLSDNVAELKRVSQAIEHGNKLFQDFAEASDGQLVEGGGDEVLIEIGAEKLEGLASVRKAYEKTVGTPVSCGIGTKISESSKALMAAKLRGGDAVVFYTPEIEEEIKKAQEQGEGAKQAEAYLSKALPGMNQGPGAGFNSGGGGGRSPASPPSTLKPMQAGQQQEESTPEPGQPANQADSFSAKCHTHAQAQEQSDSQQEADNGEQVEALKAQVSKVLQSIQGQQQVLAAMQQQAPQAYAAVVNLVQSVIAMARSLPGQEAPEQVAKSEDKEDKCKCGHSHTEDGDCSDIGCECMKFELGKEELAEAEGLPKHKDLELPVGSELDGKIKVVHSSTGKEGWIQARAGKILSQDPSGHAISSRNPGGR